MRVIYDNEIDTNVNDNVSPDDVMTTLKANYTELNNATYAITTEGGERVMRISLTSGSKA